MKKFPTLYKRAATKKIQQWTIIADGGSYYTLEGIVDGKITQSEPHTCEGKNAGKANSTTDEKQAEKEAKAKWDRKTERGYVEDIKAVDDTDFEKPMKGDEWEEREDEVVFPVTYQDKLNGVNFRVKATGVLSTGCKYYHTVPHIVKSLAPIFVANPDAVIVGEGYNPNAAFLHELTEVMTVTKKPEDLTPEFLEKSEKVAQCWVFDGYGFGDITEETPWLERIEAVKKLLKGFKYVVVEDYKVAKDKAELMKALADNKKRGGEGLMIRWDKCPIKHGRSKYMLKLKHWKDAEYVIVNVEEGNGNWAGKAKRITLKIPNPTEDSGETFASNIEGDMEYLAELWKNREDVIGEKATVKYQVTSAYGVPQLPWVIAIRNYE